MDRHGVPNAETVARIDLAAALENKSQSSLILLCGWAYRSDSQINIADAMLTYLETKYPHLAAKALCQRISRDTVGDALFSRIYLEQLFGRNHFSINIVTSSYHAERAHIIFNFVFSKLCIITVSGVNGFSSDDSSIKEQASLAAFRDTFEGIPPGDVDLSITTMRHKHPFYNGEVYPRLADLERIRLQLIHNQLNQ